MHFFFFSTRCVSALLRENASFVGKIVFRFPICSSCHVTFFPLPCSQEQFAWFVPHFSSEKMVPLVSPIWGFFSAAKWKKRIRVGNFKNSLQSWRRDDSRMMMFPSQLIIKAKIMSKKNPKRPREKFLPKSTISDRESERGWFLVGGNSENMERNLCLPVCIRDINILKRETKLLVYS